jgi:ankyrin repeat protein
MHRFSAALVILLMHAPLAAAASDTRLAEAVKRQDAAAVRTLLAQKPDVNAALADGTTALHWAVHADDLDTVSLLLRAGARVTAADRYGQTPLHLAVANGNVAIVSRLLKAGADPEARDASGETLLMTAARSGGADLGSALLDAGAGVDAADAATGEPALWGAGRATRPPVARLLLDRGANVAVRTRTGPTPPWVPPNAGGGSHGLGIIRGGWPERGARDAIPGAMTALLYAARDGRAELARMLLAAGADVNGPDANAITPLLMAITNDHMDVARVLLDAGADVDAADFWGRTPIWAAVEIRNRDYSRANEFGIDRDAALAVVRTLLERGANPNPRTKEIPPIRRWVTSLGDLTWVNFTGQTPFIRAALSGDITVMRLLLDHGADPTITTFGGTTALMAASGVNWAVQQSFTESNESLMQAVLLCLEQGNDVNAQNETGVTAVMGAANRGSDDILEVLIKAGARLDVADKEGRTPMRWAQGEFLALHPPVEKPSTIALLRKYMGTAPAPAAPVSTQP